MKRPVWLGISFPYPTGGLVGSRLVIGYWLAHPQTRIYIHWNYDPLVRQLSTTLPRKGSIGVSRGLAMVRIRSHAGTLLSGQHIYGCSKY